MSIDKEDIARLRNIAEDGIIRGVNKNWQGSEVLRLLDALEAAEARVEAAERERDALTQELATSGCPNSYDPDRFKGQHCDKDPESFLHDSQQCWLAWASQQARGGENA